MHIALDLDGTLAHYDGWKGIEHIGEPVPAMLEKVRDWVEKGYVITIFTARVSVPEEAPDANHHISMWLRKHDLPAFEVTAIKHKKFTMFIDDRAHGVIKNEGTFV